MKITQITNQHLINRIKYFENFLATKPSENIYVGESYYAEQAAEQENRNNDYLAERILNHIKYMKQEAQKRGITT